MAQAIIFDLDGTLIDSAPDLHAALNLVLAGEGVAPVTLAETMGFIGHGIPHLVEQARQARGIAPARAAAMTDAMFAHYAANPATLTRPYDGAVAFLRLLRDRGHPLALCTNKAVAPTCAILDALDLRGFFDVVIGGDSLAAKKPDPAPVLAACAAFGGALCLVGDSEVDAQAAANAGLPFALFSRGYRKSEPQAMNAAFVFDDYTGEPLYAAMMAALT